MKTTLKLFILCIILTLCNTECFSQKVVEHYNPLKNDSLKVGIDKNNFLPFIKKGYTLMLPKAKTIKGVLIFLEDSGYDKSNTSAKQMYNEASKKGFAVISVSTEIPFDFYFSKASILSTHKLIQHIFTKYNLPNTNIFFLGASLVGHRAMQYIKFIKAGNFNFQLNIKGLVICNFTLDWTRKWHQHERDIRINRINLWEPKFINYMLETALNGTPYTSPEPYHNFSAYSFFDKTNRNIKFYKDYAVRAYIKPEIKYRLKKYFRTLYENNTTDIIGFLAELELAGNTNTELIVLPSVEDSSQNTNSQSTWNEIDKTELMNWIFIQTKN